MKTLLMDFLSDEANPFHRRNRAREFLQARVLLALQDCGAFSSWAFVGGTALRFLYRLPRYSEDLDFSLFPPDSGAQFERYMGAVARTLTGEGYEVEVKTRARPAVAAAYIRFRGLLHELGVSPHQDEVFMIKVEIATRPPCGAHAETSIIRRFVLLHLHHHDKASLLAGKLHAVLTRKYTKGRDLYDLAWYLADDTWPGPNLTLLNHALGQTGWAGEPVTGTTWRRLVAEKLESLNWQQAREDVAPFLEREQDLALVDKQTLLSLLGA